MREEQFKEWMIKQGTMSKRPIGDAISRCKRVERDLEINLDIEYQKDRGNKIIGLLDYSMEDGQNQKMLPGKLMISGKPFNVMNSMASLKAAVKKYMLFCENNQ